MCIPQQPNPAAQPSPTPSLPSAQDLTLGGAAGVPRGASLLGRLKLRNSAATAAVTAATATKASNPLGITGSDTPTFEVPSEPFRPGAPLF